jgi:hypothetical protein
MIGSFHSLIGATKSVMTPECLAFLTIYIKQILYSIDLSTDLSLMSHLMIFSCIERVATASKTSIELQYPYCNHLPFNQYKKV